MSTKPVNELNLGSKDLRSRTGTWLTVTVYILIGLTIGGLAAGTGMSATVYDKHKDELGNEKNLALGTIIACAVGTILLVIFLIIFIRYFHERLVEEDRFITSMSRVATEPASAADIRTSFGDYLNKSLGTNKFGPEDIRKFGNLLASDNAKLSDFNDDELPRIFLRNTEGNFQNFNEQGRSGNVYNPLYSEPDDGSVVPQSRRPTSLVKPQQLSVDVSSPNPSQEDWNNALRAAWNK